MDTSQIYSSGILAKNEELIDAKPGVMVAVARGIFVITNKRVLFLKKPGMLSKGLEVCFECSLGAIVSVSTEGLVSKILNIQFRDEDSTIPIYQFLAGSKQEVEIIRQKILGAKAEYKEKEVITAKTIIIEEAQKKETADEILKKRLARGEITKEEFHDKIQRT